MLCLNMISKAFSSFSMGFLIASNDTLMWCEGNIFFVAIEYLAVICCYDLEMVFGMFAAGNRFLWVV